MVRPTVGHQRGRSQFDIQARQFASGNLFQTSRPAINLARFEALHTKKELFEQTLGERAVWDEMVGRLAARVYVPSTFKSVADSDLWPAMMDWLIDQHERVKRAIDAVGGLKSPGEL